MLTRVPPARHPPTPREGADPIVRPRMPELDSVRGVAILLVVFCHGYFWSCGVTGLGTLAKAFVEITRAGWLGVNLFFVLSGFLITGILLDSRLDEDYFRRFYARRALRILPAYYGLLLVLLVAGLKPRSFLVLSFFYLSNVTPLFGVVQAYAPLWSLAVEEHFYLLWPMIVRRFSTRRVEHIAIAVVCIVPALRFVSYSVGWRAGLSEYTWLVADGLAMGAWLAVLVRKPWLTRERLARISTGALAAAVIASIAFAKFGILTRRRPLGATFQESCGDLAFLGLVGLVLVAGTGRWKTLVRQPFLAFYGEISYGLYLIHVLIFDRYDHVLRHFWPQHSSSTGGFPVETVRFVICGAIATGLAFLSRRHFEEFFLHMKTRLGVRAPAVSPTLSGDPES
jgi:peptidoglycan/LPS O-acetylase OafA/YrhL